MSNVFGNSQWIETQWKKVYKARAKSTGMSELLRSVDKILQSYSYSRSSIKGVLKTKALAEKFRASLMEQRHRIGSKRHDFDDWTDKESAFLVQLENDLKEEADAWQKVASKLP